MATSDAMRIRALKFRCAIGLSLLVGGESACFSSGTGENPPTGEFYFPVAAAVAQGAQPRHLFVVSSNFDLRYNGGVIHALSLDAIEKDARSCSDTPTLAGCVGASQSVAVEKYMRGSVKIGAFAADMLAVPRYAADGTPLPSTSGRLLVSVRGDASITYVDFEEDENGISLNCSGKLRRNDRSQECSGEFRVGPDASKNDRQLMLEGEPYSLAVSSFWPSGAGAEKLQPRASRGVAAVIHQNSGNVSAFVNVNADGDSPRLAHTIGNLATNATGIAALDVTTDVRADSPFLPRFLVTNRSSSNVLLLSLYGDQNPDRSFLALSEVVPIQSNSSGFDTRGIVVDPPGLGETRPTRVFLASRSPASLVVGDYIPSRTPALRFLENVALPIGPSRVTRVSLPNENGPSGSFHSKLYVTSFDARFLAAYDPDARRLTNIARTGRGPYALKADESRKLLFVVNFTDSTIQVVELDPNKARYEQVIFTVGIPTGAGK